MQRKSLTVPASLLACSTLELAQAFLIEQEKVKTLYTTLRKLVGSLESTPEFVDSHRTLLDETILPFVFAKLPVPFYVPNSLFPIVETLVTYNPTLDQK